MSLELLLFLGGQAVALLAAIIGTYVKISVRLGQIELMLQHTDQSSASNSRELIQVKEDLHKLTLKVEHIQTMQQMLCHACPLRPANNMKHIKEPKL